MKINIKRLDKNAIIPTRGSQKAAGYDLYAHIPGEYETVLPDDVKVFGTGVAMEIPDGYVGLIFPRSGLSTKKRLKLANCVGVIDSDYRGEIGVSIHNESKDSHEIHNHDRIAQIVFVSCLDAEFNEVDELNNTDRGEGGFGSTGK